MNGTRAWTSLGRSATRRALMGAIAIPATLALLAGCSGHGTVTVDGTAGPADVSTSSPASTAGGSSTAAPVAPNSGSAGSATSSGSSTSSGHGCPAGGISIPTGAGTATTADLDGDGKPDRIWLDDIGGHRTLGVRTASGAGFSTRFQNAAPEAANAVAGRMSNGAAIILLDLSRSAALYAVVNCKIVPSINAQGQQYVFDEGFTGYGTGAGCPTIGSGRRLTGYQATPNANGSAFKVTRTAIDLSRSGQKASNGPTVTLGTKLSPKSPTVTLAQEISCGVSPRALEPAN